MASFLAGAAAQLVGAGMQAVGIGIPVGETSAKVIDGLRNYGAPVPPKNWFKSKQDTGKAKQRTSRDERASKTIYDKLERHINGMIQVAKPAIELKKLVRENCCKSAEPTPSRRATPPPSTDNLRCYTPPNCSSGACDLFSDQQAPSPQVQRKAAKKSSKREKRQRAKRRDRDSSSDEEDEHCMYCSRSRSLLTLPCGRLICSKCDETGDHELELNMPRIKTRQTPKPLLNPVAVIDLTQDSPSNSSLRLSRIQRRRNEEVDADCSDDNEVVIPLDDSTEDSDDDVEDLNLQRPNKTAVVINLEDTINLDEKSSEEAKAKQLLLNESPNKKGNLSCPICFESLADDNVTPMSTPCGHVYCLGCLRKMTQAKKKCALCQRSISLGKCIRLHI